METMQAGARQIFSCLWRTYMDLYMPKASLGPEGLAESSRGRKPPVGAQCVHAPEGWKKPVLHPMQAPEILSDCSTPGNRQSQEQSIQA